MEVARTGGQTPLCIAGGTGRGGPICCWPWDCLGPFGLAFPSPGSAALRVSENGVLGPSR